MLEPNFAGKPLPSPGRDKLPSLPPSELHDDNYLPPQTPSKSAGSYEQGYQQGQPVSVGSSPRPAMSGSATPVESNSMAAEQKPKKTNPLIDLIETEKLYVDQLTGIIRKIAAAWSRSNLPPPELDSMFRSIEAVYKANRALLLKLKEIGTNPSSPKALGDLLMRWIDDLEAPYTSYSQKYCSGFDSWGPVASNQKLGTVLETFSAANPPPPSSDHPGPYVWTLDELFLLPKARLKYYKKLYNRLLKSTTPGRSDHRLLLGALDKLDRLLSTLDERQRINVGQSDGYRQSEEGQDDVVIDMRDKPRASDVESARMSETSGTSSARDSAPSSGERSSQTPSTSISRGSTSTLSMPISDLERRLATDRTLDIFTMQPKVVKLQMSPPTLTFTREVRMSLDVVITLTPNATGVEVVHRQGHIFLLTDLFLVCERISPEDRAHFGPDGPDMWLCYPPLAGKVLRVSEVEGQNNAVRVAVMRKEHLVLYTESEEARNRLLAEFKDCIETAGSLPPASRQAPPPMPSLPDPTRQNLMPQTLQRSDSQQSANSNGPMGLPSTPHPQGPIGRAVENLVLAHEAQVQQGAQRVPQIQEPAPGHPGHRTSDSARPGVNLPLMGPPRGQSLVQSPQEFSGPGIGQYGAGRPQYSEPPSPNRPFVNPPGRAPSDPSFQGGLRKVASAHTLQTPQNQHSLPPMPPLPGGPPQPSFYGLRANNSYGSLPAPTPHTLLPSAQIRAVSMAVNDPVGGDMSPPGSPIEETAPTGPVTSAITAQMKCKVFLKQQHQQWKAMGSAKLKLYHQSPTNVKQLVVEAENKDKTVMISTIVLTDGVERVGKTGVAIELSDKGARTGIVYMIQLRNETSAGGLFDSLLAGSDRSAR